MPDSRRSALKIASHIALYVLFLISFLCIALIANPYQRGFFCDDESIRFPYKDDTVTVAMLLGVGMLVPIGVIVAIEVLPPNTKYGSTYTSNSDIQRTKSVYARCYVFIGLLLFGGLMQMFTVFITKYSVGRLRPNFLAVCQPDWTQVKCTDERGHPRYITDYTCTTDNEKRLSDSRQSFPSGHASQAAFVAVYMVMYLQARFIWKGSKLLKPALQLMFLWAALFTGISRVMDNKHHMTDVITGWLIGMAIALFIFTNTASLRQPSLRTVTRYLVALCNEQQSRLDTEQRLSTDAGAMYTHMSQTAPNTMAFN